MPERRGMQYLGGKSKLAKQIAAHIDQLAAEIAAKTGRFPQIEDRFCGALSVAAAIKSRPLICSDANEALICTLQAVKKGWVPPVDLSEEEYKELKKRNDPRDRMTAFAAAGCSFGGKWWGGYARQSGGLNYAGCASRSLVRKICKPAPFDILHRDYKDCLFSPQRPRIVYFDPPYRDSVGYPAVGSFDHDEFWNLAEQLARSGVAVRVSEYTAPAGWERVCCFGDAQIMGRSRGAKKVRADYLFKLAGCP